MTEDRRPLEIPRHIADTGTALGEAVQVLRAIESLGHVALVVGGAVRDLALGLEPHDVDIATNAPFEELGASFRLHDVGRSKDFGLVVLRSGAFSFQVAQLRGATRLDAAGKPVGQDEGATFLEDAGHRDFTVNAMALDARGDLLDPFGGMADIASRQVRAVLDPAARMAEDPLRAVRAVRLAAKYGFRVEERTAEAAAAIAPGLAAVAPERLADELLKMAAIPGPAFADAVAMLARLGLLRFLIPEVDVLRGLPHDAVHHPEGDVFEHTLAALRAHAGDDREVNLAVLFHDLGKARTHEIIDGRHRYHGHDHAGEAIVAGIGGRLRWGNAITERLAYAAAHHMQVFHLGEMRPSKVHALVTSPAWGLLKSVSRCDRAARGSDARLEELDRSIATAERDAAAWREKAMPGAGGASLISGTRVMELAGLTPGPLVGQVVREVTAWAMDGGVTDRDAIEREAAAIARRLSESRGAAGR